MSLFGKKFLREGKGFFSRETKARVSLGVFGKHPGWDDHIDDIGLDTDSLLLAKQILYVDGIGGQINSGEWEKLDQAQGLAEFKHVFIWKRRDAFLVGKICSSRDGKNRTKYPIIICSHCQGIPFERALIALIPIITQATDQCKAVGTADEVRSIVRLAQDDLRRALVAGEADLQIPEVLPDTIPFVELLGMEHEALYRTLYYLQTRMACYQAGEKKDDSGEWPPRQIRLPAAGDYPEETFIFWCRFLESQLEKDLPILLTLPVQESWLDATIGEPGTKELYALRARPAVLNVACDVPYIITSEFRETNRDLIQALMEGAQWIAPRPPFRRLCTDRSLG